MYISYDIVMLILKFLIWKFEISLINNEDILIYSIFKLDVKGK